MSETRVLAVANQKGGVAKTTTVASLGAAMVDKGRRVLLVDLDPQGCLTFSLGQDPDKLPVSVHEVLLGEVEPNAALVTTAEGMTLLPANIDLAGAEAMLLMRAGREYALKRALAKLDRPVRRRHHRLPALAGRADPQRADRRRRGDRAVAVRDAGPPRRRAVPAHRRRRSADHQPESAAAGRIADAVRLAHHPHPRRAARRRRPLRPAGAGSARSRARCASPRPARRARRCWPGARTRAPRPIASWRRRC